MNHLPLSSRQDPDGSWSIYLGHVAVRYALSREEAEWWHSRLPQEVVSGTPSESTYRSRGPTAERITGLPNSRAVTVATPLGLVRKSADNWGFGLYDGEYRYWFRTPARPAPIASQRQGTTDDPDWIQTDGLPVVTATTLVWVGLNPSTSDDNPQANRLTLSKVLKWAQRLEMIEVLGINLFAYRHTDPKKLRAKLSTSEVQAAVGEYNDRVLDHVLTGNGTVLAAWGANGSRLGRGQTVRSMIPAALCLGLCANGEPKHPARISQATPLTPLYGT